MTQLRPSPVSTWSSRWGGLARAAGIAPDERLLVALSGGADSVLLLHLLAAAEPRPRVLAVHVHHGLRGREADRDAGFCANLCRSLGFPHRERRLRLEANGSSLEARARRERYRVLVEEALHSGHRTIVSGHHSDDALETLLMRWMRGTRPAGWRGPQPALELGGPRPFGLRVPEEPASGEAAPLRIVRPLLPLRREEVRRLLRDRGLRWREDSSNLDDGMARNALRHSLLTSVSELCGVSAVERLRAFGRAVEDLEDRLARTTAHIAWSVPRYATASRGPADRALGGVLPRSQLMRLPRPLCRRVLWRLLTEGTGQAPARVLLERILDDLAQGRCTRHALPDGWMLWLRASELHLLPPAGRRTLGGTGLTHKLHAPPLLPFPGLGSEEGDERPSRSLAVPGIVTLCDGRRISAELLEGDQPLPRRGEREVELDAEGLPACLSVRWPRPGDRFHGLGAPGSKRLCRFLADRGVPREERPWVPLVLAGEEIIWVSGLEPGESRKLRRSTRRRLRLTLHNGS
jgi:tRNA(Ile)-lysidine synthase